MDTAWILCGSQLFPSIGFGLISPNMEVGFKPTLICRFVQNWYKIWMTNRHWKIANPCADYVK